MLHIPSSIRRRAVSCLGCSLVVAAFSAPYVCAADRLSYNADVRPLLVEYCFSCHGADSAGRKAGLRLDRRDDAVEHGAIVPGDPDSSLAIERIFSADPEEVMPPPAIKKPLSPEQKEILRRWIESGGEYEPHWSLLPPRRAELPPVKHAAWVRNPIDRFVLARLEAESLEPAPEADRRTLARRAALDVTGLPPDPQAVEAFVNDPREDAYERYVDGLLAMPEWGEHRARYWLDYARYADTHGLHVDAYREMWSYRQWVIEAFNRNLPFDRFTVLQLAGDIEAARAETMAADADRAALDERLDSRIASGFHRCNPTTNEGGVIEQEMLALYARDRTETTATVWMGLTAGCAVCHDHKFDPLSQREFYELSAFFTNTTQAGMDGNVADTRPAIVVPRPDDRPRFAAVEKELPTAKQAVANRKREAVAAFNAWVAALDAASLATLRPHDTPVFQLEPGREPAVSAATRVIDGPGQRPAVELNGRACEVVGVGDFEHDAPFSVSAWIRVPADGQHQSIVAKFDVRNGQRGWEAWVQGRSIGLHLVHEWPSDALRVAATLPSEPGVWTRITIAYDGSGSAAGVRIYADGKDLGAKASTKTFQRRSIRTDVPLTVGSRSNGGDAKALGVTELRVYARSVSEDEARAVAIADACQELVGLAEPQRKEAAKKLYDRWLEQLDQAYRAAAATLKGLEQERAAIRARGTVAHVMDEKPTMPEAFVLSRGEYDKPLDKVHPATPRALPAFPDALPRDRLGLAQWLLLPEHPLTARVTVNRFWQEVFGTGIVRTAGDFGITGELPSHPELLDWLAIEFRESGWDVKRLFRLMLTTATYRQQARATPEKLAKDGANRLLSRGPRFRLDAEMIRDQALAASGLLVRRVGGPSVKPYQPDGIWEAVSIGGNTSKYERDAGDGLYRRSLYWFWKRAAPPASLEILNAPTRETCVVKRERTNTPLQALVTLNDPQLIEAARVLADNVLMESYVDDTGRLDALALRLLSRPLRPAEHAVLRESLATLAAWYETHADDARAVVAIGESKPRTTDVAVLATWTMLANELMNYDEVLCK